LRDSIDIAVGDIRNSVAVRDACRNADVIYHLAALAKPWVRDPAEFFDVNLTGTYNVCRAASARGVHRLVHMSTALVSPPPGVLYGAEITNITPYQRSKAEGEKLVQRFVERGGDAVIVRPTRVFGPGLRTAGNTVTRLIDLYRRGRFRFRIADENANANYVLVDDVVQGMLLASANGSAGETYALGGANCTLPDFLRMIEQAGAKPRWVIAVPQQVAKMLAFGFEIGGYVGIEPQISRDWVRLLAVDWRVSSLKAEEDLGYRTTPLPDAVKMTLEWLEAGRQAPEAAQTQGGVAA
jgi:nucleoside-diphosphate-sugar epimerase